MELLKRLGDPAAWWEFYEYKQAGGHLPPAELEALETFITRRDYAPIVAEILAGGTFAPPKKTELSKLHSEKKRRVYTYPEGENRVLKLLTYLLQRRYDGVFADNLYSFRPKKGALEALRTLTRDREMEQLWAYKADVRNYFNAVPVPRLLPMLGRVLQEVPQTLAFLTRLLENPLVEENGCLVAEEKGIMAGTPISAFLANVYLSDLDHAFAARGLRYARYSDDIIFFAPTRPELEAGAAFLRDWLGRAGLELHPEKVACTGPTEAWTYLGLSYQAGVVDVAPASVAKLKGKMRRKMRALERWRARKGASGIQAARAFVRVFHRKLFENPACHELTWARWYFPLLTTDRSLREIDHYCQSCIRRLATGKQTKAAYNFRYEDMKQLGYTPLVHGYYTSRKA